MTNYPCTNPNRGSKAGDASWVIRKLKPGFPLYLLVILLVSAVSILALVDPLIVKWLVDYVLPRGRIDLLIWAMLSILMVHLVRLTLHTLAGATTNYAGQILAFRIRVGLVRRILGLSATFLGKTNVGELIQRVDRDVEQLCQVGGGVASALLRMSVSLLTVIGTMFYLNWKLTFALLPCLPAFLLLRKYYRGRLQHASDAFRENVGRQSDVLQQVLGGILHIQMLGCQRAIVHRFGMSSRDCVRADIDRQKHEFAFALSSAFVIAFGIAEIFGFGGWQVIKGTLTIGGLIAFYTYFTRLFDPLANAVEATTKLQRMRPHIRQLRDLEVPEHGLFQPPLVPALRRRTALLAREIRFHGVSFSYRPGSPVLSNLDFQVRAGTMVAIVGANGSGKSTIFKLLTRMYDPQSGSIRLDNHEVGGFSVRNIRSMISIVLQEPVLFSMSLRENILLSNPRASAQQLQRAVQLASLEPVISRLRSGLDEKIGPGGITLSGGECQRVALARAMLQDKPILLLDEATSNLDPEAEHELGAIISQELRDRLVLATTHRPALAAAADRVLVLNNGSICADGSHSLLRQNLDFYNELWHDGTSGQVLNSGSDLRHLVQA